MKKFIEKVITWFKESNRYKHAIAGLGVFSLTVIFNSILCVETFANVSNALIVVLIAMITAEYKDERWGGKFDLYDIIAGIVPVCIIYIIYVLIMKF